MEGFDKGLIVTILIYVVAIALMLGCGYYDSYNKQYHIAYINDSSFYCENKLPFFKEVKVELLNYTDAYAEILVNDSEQVRCKRVYNYVEYGYTPYVFEYNNVTYVEERGGVRMVAAEIPAYLSGVILFALICAGILRLTGRCQGGD